MGDELQPSEITTLASKMAQAYAEMVRYYRDTEGLTQAESEAKAQDGGDLAWLREQALTAPPDQVSWWQLERLEDQDPEAVRAAWERQKALAREELQSGMRGADAVEEYDWGPWGRARFAALWQTMIDEWHPRGGIERALVETLAQAHSAYLFWLQRLTRRVTVQVAYEEGDMRREGKWTPPQQSQAEAWEQAAAMVDRFNRIFLRTLRALRDLRRYAPSVTIQNAGQVNIAQQQTNTAELTPGVAED